jgi:hypothetical protein
MTAAGGRNSLRLEKFVDAIEIAKNTGAGKGSYEL